MRILVLVLCLLDIAATQAGELDQAYKKEFAYLVAEKKALQQRLENLRENQKENLAKITDQIALLQKVFLKKQNITDRLNREIVEASRNADYAENDSALLDTTLTQAEESLGKLNTKLDQSASQADQLSQAFDLATRSIVEDGNVSTSEGDYFLPNGESHKGKIINVGRIAKYGVSPQGGGILAPAGSGKFKVWSGDTLPVAEQLVDSLYPKKIPVFLYDSAEKAVEKQDKNSFGDDLQASGLVGEVILVFGVIGLILVSMRIYMLVRASSNIQRVADKVNRKIHDGDIDGALEWCKKNISAVSSVIMATVKNLHRDRDHIEDIISESILHESSRIDRFGTAILVIAAISPLLGLLGTVTGMISTFDIITEFGTGDPKLLSSGISEALLTTKFGLVVAIPMLLAGNLLTNWARRIKSDLEQAALHMINNHKV
jgi:biopolymer transport protein ExbB